MINTLLLIGESVIAGALVFWVQRCIKRWDIKAEAHAKARKVEALLQLEMSASANDLSYACAMALKRGRANGEVERAIESYREAKEKYFAFLNEAAYENII